MNTTEGPSAKACLWLVDDDRLVLAMLSRGLQLAGFDILTAESAEEAQALLANGLRPDLAILDIRMGGADGLSLARRLRELDHVPFMMLSAYSDPTMIEEAARSGALGYLVKPLDIPQLVPAIEAALSRANDLSELRETRQQLQAALDAERDISVAIGIIMSQMRLPRQEAFDLLRKTARAERRKLAQLATAIISGAHAVQT